MAEEETKVAAEAAGAAEEQAKGKCILLVSSTPHTQAHEKHTARGRAVLQARKIVYEEVDGANEENRELRNELFAISGKRGLYPQFFIAYGGHYFFAGDWEKIESLNEMVELDEAVRSAPRADLKHEAP
uniref:Glutaredoxin domain-containing protein n=1 Tax=Phaeomonas parva TaxID=124430 RepID=A0A7S1TXY1_9STRA|mmetsp:Transcript_20506/g.62503  ORF Transcript_20506/g.62503 Transcript_20506/m.62503 type:complete len:129 (+) Transcript_20506:163-549(+)